MSNRRRRQKRAELRNLVLGGVLAVSTATTASAQNPTGGNVVAGAATISNAGSTLNVNASTDRAVINWQSFSIGQGNTANFNLPSASSAVLNRVTTPNTPSAIHGALNSNGNVFLVNPSGVLVGPSGVINTNGFTASTFDIGTKDFMNGGPMTFRGSSTADIVNQGTINTGSGGAHFIANQFNNSGTINSLGGSVTVGSGQSVTYSNGVTHVEADMATLQNGYSETASLINNTGTIRATGAVMAGGEVYLTNPGGKVFNSGTIAASQSVSVNTGQLNHIGTIDTSGTTGGSVTVTSNDALVQGRIDASGTQSGGDVQIQSNTVDQYAAIDASSDAGTGGNVQIETTNAYTATIAGDIDVSGADGGSIAITGPGRIVTSATLDATGATGNGGSIDVSSSTKTSMLGATFDASGAVDGGTIRVGGEYQGGRDLTTDELANSGQTLISPGSQIIATGESGQGGTAIVWSDERTQFYGGVDVSGSGADGTGGFVELSSAGLLKYQITDEVQTGGGTVLLDPKNGVIVDTAPSGMDMITFSLLGSGDTFLDAFDRFGVSVGLNSAGDRLAVGAIGDDGGSVLKGESGAVYLFDLDTNSVLDSVSLAQILRDGAALSSGGTLELEAGDRFGSAVDFDGPGGILAVGASRDDFLGFDQSNSLLDDTGAVYLFQLSTTDLSQAPELPIVIRDGIPLVGGGVFDLRANESNSINAQLGGDLFGTSVALDEDGNRLVVGANGFTNSFVYLFEINPTNLAAAPNLAQRLGSDTLSTLGDLDAAGFGESVALNASGSILAVGAPELNNRAGGVYLFNLISQNFGQPARFRQLVENGPGGPVSVGQAEFGSGVALNAVGDLLGVGAENLGFLNGGVFGFQLNPSDLTVTPNLLIQVSDGVQIGDTTIEIGVESYGADIALDAAGTRVVVGAPGFDGDNRVAQDSGAVSLFDLEFTGTTFRYEGRRLSTDAISTTMPDVSGLGLAVELGSNKTQLAVSSLGPEFGDEFGQVHFFLLDEDNLNTVPTLVTTLRNGVGIDTPVGLETLQLDDQDMFGSSISIADNGNLLAIGAAGDDGVGNMDMNSGAIYLFEVDQTDPVVPLSLPQVIRNQQSLSGGQTLMLGDNSGFGGAIALTEDGQRLAAGASGDSKVFLFEFGAGGFMGPATLAQTIQDGTTLADTTTLDIPFSPIGYGLDVNSDGSRLAVGERNGAGGGVYLFELNANDWSQTPDLAQELRRGVTLADGSTLSLVAGGEFGRGISFNDAGDRLAVGQPSDFNLNSVFLFELDTNDLSVTADLKQVIRNDTPLASGDTFQGGDSTFGQSVSLDGSGDRLAVGNPDRNRFHLFDFGGGGFEQTVNLAQSISNDSPLGGLVELPAFSGFGGAVALNGTGERLAVESNRSIYLFDVDTTLASDPVLGQVLRSGSGLSDGRILDIDLSDSDFGNSLALNGAGDILAVGDPEDRGAVFLFSLDRDDLSVASSLDQYLSDFTGPTELDLDFNDRFGFSVDLNLVGDRLAVGAIGDQGITNNSGFQTGAVYLFDLNTDDLSETPEFRAVIQDGAITGFGLQGAMDPSVVTQIQLDAGDRFGSSVALTDEGSYLLVGAPGDDGINNMSTDAGNVYAFRVPPVDAPTVTTFDQLYSMTEQSALVGSEFVVEAGDQFGTSLSFAGPGFFPGGVGTDVLGQINGHALAVGAPGDDGATNGQQDTGAVWLFAANTLDPEVAGGEGSFEGGSPLNFFDVLRFPELDGIGGAVDLSRNGQLLAIGAEFDSLPSPGDAGVRPSVGSVSLIGFGGGGESFPLTGDLAFSDFPADTTFIDPDDIVAILNAGNDLVLQFSNDLEIRSDITTAMMGVGTLTIQTGRSINVLPGTGINIGDGSLNLEINSTSALTSQTDPGSPQLRLEDVSITASGEDSIVRLYADEFEDFFVSDEDPFIHLSNSEITATEIQIGTENYAFNDDKSFLADQRILIDRGSRLAGELVSLRASNNLSGIGIEILGASTELVATEALELNSIGGIRLADGATLRGSGNGIVGLGLLQLPSDAPLQDLIDSGDALVMNNASILTENGDVLFEFVSEDIIAEGENATTISDDPKVQRNFATLVDSQIVAGGEGSAQLLQAGDDGYSFDLTNSTLEGKNVLIALNALRFSPDAGFSTFRLSDGSQVNTAPDGELRVFLPQQDGVQVDASSSLNGVFGDQLFNANANLNQSQGLGEIIGQFSIDVEYLGVPDANYAFYLATTDLGPGLFFTANDGQSTYGQTPVDPGLSITRGVLHEGDSLQSIGVGTDFDLTQFSDAGTYTINVEATDLDPKYRLLGTASGTFTILPADLVVTGGTYTKTYGDTFVFPDNDFTVEGLVNGEMIGPVQWLSLGTRPDADVMETPYAVGLSVSGQGTFNPLNYNISFSNGGLTVIPADLVVNPLSQQKTYGDSMLDRTRFEAIGLKNGETIQQVSFSSPGIAATANVGSYDLAASGIAAAGNGFDANNYNIELGSLSGGLMVTPAPLQISADDQLKLIGTEFVFDGTEFTVSGLKNSDTVSQVDLASEGAPAEAELGQYVITAMNPVGNLDLGNYDVTLNNGVFTVRDEIPLPNAVIRTDNLVYDQFGRYIDFAKSINVLTPNNPGTISLGQAPATMPAIDGQESDEIVSASEESSGEVYLRNEIRNSSRDSL
ncbi:filamentous hemagglutinin N-terminal domain-containing protein [Rhodopirellula sp. JC740]|uniref:Filamentous hemagglutinin N-terminal domain-containing protein n=1 Tax=Rhodopirellula halodulae TaxID=2894198 RepID=A0ABS8NIH7_9BACT|nr:MBG domain-containing protein [Rhodopirellula sp. JC740]MCC9643364.1 filamentous hemagglutinin N-terminal domain-containing protein [Rhodopirellula sp. JC740]